MAEIKPVAFDKNHTGGIGQELNRWYDIWHLLSLSQYNRTSSFRRKNPKSIIDTGSFIKYRTVSVGSA